MAMLSKSVIENDELVLVRIFTEQEFKARGLMDHRLNIPKGWIIKMKPLYGSIHLIPKRLVNTYFSTFNYYVINGDQYELFNSDKPLQPQSEDYEVY